MTNVHRLGLTRLTDVEETQYDLNVVFIHGLRGHPRGTWEAAAGLHPDGGKTEKSRGFRSLIKRPFTKPPSTSTEQAQPSPSTLQSSTIFWPEQYLASDFSKAQIWTYGYDADVIGGLFQSNNKNSISQHGRDLSVKLEREIDNDKPIAFIVHSLGGVVLKDAIRRSGAVCNQTKLIIFLGTPHRGSAYSGWGQIASNLARLALQDSNKKLLETLEVNNEVLDNIHEEFKVIAFKGAFKIHSFQEAQGITGMKGLDAKVVDDFSSKLDLPRELETVESINANHMQMARYYRREDEGYRAISSILKAFLRQELHFQQTPSTNARGTGSNARFIMPFSKDKLFVGRKDIIANITEHRAASQTHTRTALYGLGGIGKSQIAIEYAHKIRRAEPDTSVVWIHASNAARFQQGYRDIADKILLPGREVPGADIMQLVYSWLSESSNGQWLMILDNVDDDGVFFAENEDTVSSAEHEKSLESFLPHTPNVRILITSRNRTAAINLVGGHGDVVPVEPMAEVDALALLQTRVPLDESNISDAKALIHALEGIPLAITHAAAYIKTRAPMTTVSSYLKLFHESEANQVHLLSNKEWKDIRRDHDSRHAVMRTWQISFRQIRERQPLAANLLALMCMFDKQGIPKRLVQAGTSELDFTDALAPLLSFSLVRAEVGEQAFEMHRLVQLSTRMWLEAENELGKWVKKSTQVLSAAFPSGDYETWTECEVILPHAKEVMSHATRDEKDSLEQARIGYTAGWYQIYRGECKAAETCLRMSAEVRERVLGQEHPLTLLNVGDIGVALERQGKYGEAEVIQRQVLEKREKVLGLEHPDTLCSVAYLGSALCRQGKYGEAEVIQRQVLEKREKVLGLEHVDTLFSASELGVALERQGKYEEAEAIRRQILAKREKVLGLEHPNTLCSVAYLGSALCRQNRYKEAEVMHRRAAEGMEKVYGWEHPNTLSNINSLAEALSRQGRWEEAEIMYQRSQEALEKVLGPEHPYTVTGVHNLASLFHQQHEYRTALKLFQRAYSGFVKALGADHPDTLGCLQGLNYTIELCGGLAGIQSDSSEGSKEQIDSVTKEQL
ncbi:MAG: hypothetical protein M1820_009354 [Bogoriella megaspora]|nr:MAG: hypothetical protein M1820_009354 [Bogoriella megaspora]